MSTRRPRGRAPRARRPSWPSRTSSRAAVSPAKPAPTTTTSACAAGGARLSPGGVSARPARRAARHPAAPRCRAALAGVRSSRRHAVGSRDFPRTQRDRASRVRRVRCRVPRAERDAGGGGAPRGSPPRAWCWARRATSARAAATAVAITPTGARARRARGRAGDGRGPRRPAGRRRARADLRARAPPRRLPPLRRRRRRPHARAMATALSCVLDELPCVHYGMLLLGGTGAAWRPTRRSARPSWRARCSTRSRAGRAALMANHGAIVHAARPRRARSSCAPARVGVHGLLARRGDRRAARAGRGAARGGDRGRARARLRHHAPGGRGRMSGEMRALASACTCSTCSCGPWRRSRRVRAASWSRRSGSPPPARRAAPRSRSPSSAPT